MERYFELDKNFNFITERKKVLDEENTASGLYLNNIFIISLKRLPLTFQTSHNGYTSITANCTSTIITK